jgi:hypothetical protein
MADEWEKMLPSLALEKNTFGQFFAKNSVSIIHNLFAKLVPYLF